MKQYGKSSLDIIDRQLDKYYEIIDEDSTCLNLDREEIEEICESFYRLVYGSSIRTFVATLKQGKYDDEEEADLIRVRNPPPLAVVMS